MNKNFVKVLLLSAVQIVLTFFSANSQVIEKNGIFYHDFIIAPDSLTILEQYLSVDNNQLSKQQNLPFIKDNFIINSLDGDYGCDQSNVVAAMDGNGNSMYAWIDYRNYEREIYAQMLNSNGNKLGVNFKVNDNKIIGNNSPFVAANKHGDFVIAWLQNFNYVIVQRFNRLGQKLGNNIIVNTIYGFNTTVPSVAINNDGSFIVAWSSEVGNWKYQVYARLFDFTGTPMGSERLISEPGINLSSIGSDKQIDVDEAGNYCITWSAYVGNSNSNIYLQMLNKFGQLSGSNILVSDPLSQISNVFPNVSAVKGGSFLVAWTQTEAVAARVYSRLTGFATAVLRFNDPQHYTYPRCLSSSDRDSTFYLLTGNYGSGYVRKIKSSGEFDGDTTRISFNLSANEFVYASDLTDVRNNRLMVALSGYARSDQNAYAQNFTNQLIAIGNAEKLHDDIGSAFQRLPSVKFNNQGKSISVWEDQRNGRSDLYAQTFDENFNPVNVNIQINDSSTDSWFLREKEIVSLSDGTFIIVFTGSDEYYKNIIWLQAVSALGEKIGSRFKLKGDFFNENIKIAVNTNYKDDIIVCWYSQYGGTSIVLDKSLSVSISEVNFLKYITGQLYRPFNISIDDEFNLFAVWKKYDNASNKYSNQIYGQIFNKFGLPFASPFVVDSTHLYILDIKCKNEGKNDYIIVYKDEARYSMIRRYTLDKEYRYETRLDSYSYSPTSINITKFKNRQAFITYIKGLDVKGIYFNDNRRSAEEFDLHSFDYINTNYNEFNGIVGTDIHNDNLFFTYESSRNKGSGSDIWGNVRKIEKVDFEEELFFEPVTSDYLYNNFPNPFNGFTKIFYELLAYHRVKLIVYDVLGREVAVLVNEDQEKGVYDVGFDASGLAAGVYFYKLEAFHTTVKKMVLLK